MAQHALDIEQPEALTAFLRAHGHIADDERPRIDVLAGGVSNRTVRVRRETGEQWVLKQGLAKLRVAVDWFGDPQRVHREALALRWLGELLGDDAVPRLVFEDRAHHVIAMTAVPEPHENLKAILLEGRLEVDHLDQFARLLGRMHRLADARRDELRPAFDDTRHFESLRLEPYYGYSAAQVNEAAAFLHELITQTRARRQTLVHGDFSPKNVLVHDGRLVLLDHEVSHWGDPAFDVGFAMTHLLSKAHHRAAQRAAFADAARRFWRIYRDTLANAAFADGLEAWAVRHGLACLLARVAGRSPLEYLTDAQRDAQRRAVTSLMHNHPTDIESLIERFIAGISRS